MNVIDESKSLFLEFSNAPCFRFKINTAQQVVGYSVSLLEGDLVCDDREAAIHLHRVAIDDFTVESGGQVHCKLSAAISFAFRKAQMVGEWISITLDLPVPVAPSTAMSGSMLLLRPSQMERRAESITGSAC